MTQLKPGFYVLTRDVENPRPDRRKKRDSRAVPVWKKGARIRIDRRVIDIPRGIREELKKVGKSADDIACMEIQFVDDRWPSLHSISEGDDNGQFDTIAPYLQPAEEDFDAWAQRVKTNYWYNELLEMFIAQGKTTREEIEGMIEEIENRAD